MEKMELMAVSGFLGVLASWWSQQYLLILLVAVALVFDYITGIMSAAKLGEISSRAAMEGLYKKVAYLLLLCLGFFIDVYMAYFAEMGLGFEIPFSLPFGLMIAAWIVLGESISIVENLAEMGVALPGFLGKVLEKAKGKVGE